MAGRPKSEKTFSNMLRIAIAEAGEKEGTTKLRDVADALVKEAIGGNIGAIKEIADRLDGKVPQAVIGDEENPLHFVHAITRKIIDASHSGD